MARSAGVSVENNFVNGLVTEATGLNFPENAVTDALNVIFRDTGKVSRRRGLDFEPGTVSRPGTWKDGQPVITYLWENAANDGDVQIAVVQIGSSLNFYRVSANSAISANFITSHFMPNNNFAPIQFATGMGKLIATARSINPTIFSYNGSTVVNEGTVSLKIRDFKLLEDGTNGGRSASYPGNTWYYNMINMGWDDGHINLFKQQMGYYPSSLWDQQWMFMKPFTIQGGSTAFTNENIALEIFSPKTTLEGVDMSRSEAPRGRMIFNAFNLARDVRIKKSGVPVHTTGERPTCVAFYAGRAFYGGVPSAEFSNTIYYTQIIEGEGNEPFAQCYQRNDPTAQTINAVLATDGGQVRIPEMGLPQRIMVVGGELMIFASNGIWTLGGSTGTGFSATDFTIKKVSSVPCIGPYTFIDAGGSPIWWNYDGIYTISVNAAVGQIQVSSLIDKKIRKFFNEKIPNFAKKFAQGAFNPITKEIMWVYSTNTGQAYSYDSALCMNIATGAFYPHQWDTSTVTVHGLMAVKGAVLEDTTVAIRDALGNDIPGVEVKSSAVVGLSNTFKFLCSSNSSFTPYGLFTFADMNDELYRDWATPLGPAGAKDYTSYFVSGYKVHGDAMRKHQSNYVQVYADTFEDDLTQCYIQGIWDYYQSSDKTRWTSPQLLAFTNVDKDYDTKRVKIRGNGKSLQLKFEAFPGEPMELIGWALFESVNSTP